MKLCKIDGCGRDLYAKGFCNMHWKRQWKGQPIDVPVRGTLVVCSLPGCTEKIPATGYLEKPMCRFHSDRHNHGIDLTQERHSLNPDQPCAIHGCSQVHYGRNFCKFHYQRFIHGDDLEAPKHQNIARDPQCIARAGEHRCKRTHHSRGLCSGHYSRLRDGRPLNAPWQKNSLSGRKCSFPGCGRDHKAKSLCSIHYQQKFDYGMELKTIRKRKRRD